LLAVVVAVVTLEMDRLAVREELVVAVVALFITVAPIVLVMLTLAEVVDKV
jgi:hypothetical protein